METETSKHNHDKLAFSPAAMPLEKELWLVDQLTLLAEAFGESAEKISPQRLQMYSANLAELPVDQLKVAFLRAARELKFFPKIAELRELAGANAEEAQAAIAHRAWDVLLNYVDTWIHADCEGCYGPQQGCRTYPPPKLDQRILDCARRLGGWKRLKTASEDDVPFLKKDFIDEYLRWEAVEFIDVSRLIEGVPEVKRLVEKPMDPPPPKVCAEQRTEKPKPVCEPLSPGQIRDRREMLRQQAELMRVKYGQEAVAPGSV